MAKSRLKVILAEEDILVKELAYTTGIHPSTLSKIINGRKPHIETAYLITDGLCELTGRNYHIDQVFPNYYSYAKRKKARR